MLINDNDKDVDVNAVVDDVNDDYDDDDEHDDADDADPSSSCVVSSGLRPRNPTGCLPRPSPTSNSSVSNNNTSNNANNSRT